MIRVGQVRRLVGAEQAELIKVCSADPRFVNDDGERAGLWISIKRDDRNNWNRLARALAAAGQPAPPLVP